MMRKLDTEKLAKELAARLSPGSVLSLYGGLGAGKTTLAREVIRILTGVSGAVSPTFTLVQEYEGKGLSVAHYDFYRLKSADEVFELGLEDFISRGMAIIEWPEIIEDYLEKFSPIKVRLELRGTDRFVKVEG
jgi:tRNA threonylcarbamoyl adenosine modification protein YjeE